MSVRTRPSDLAAAHRRIAELEALTLSSDEASHAQRVEDLQTQLYSERDSPGESRLALESSLQDTQRELHETKQALEQVLLQVISSVCMIKRQGLLQESITSMVSVLHMKDAMKQL